jgi:hypothetical protein
MHAADRALVVHRTATRIRIKIPQRQRQDAYFAALRRALLQHPDVLGVHVNPLAASVAIECRDGFAFLTQDHRFAGLELRPVQAHALGLLGPGSSLVGASAYSLGRDTGEVGAVGLAAPLIKLLVALATKQLGAQLIEWALAAVVAAATGEARRIAAPPRLPPPPALLVALSQ